jgi:glycosyltransferase involved in cell wall biosynthesis
MMKLRLIDPFVTRASPSMRSLVASLDVILEVFSEIEVLATECEWSHPKVRFHPIKRRFKPWPLHALDFGRQARKLTLPVVAERGTIIQETGCITPHADIRYMHFWNAALQEESAKRDSLKLPLTKRIFCNMAAKDERKTARDPASTGTWWVVSRSIAEKIKHDANGVGNFSILPNVFDPSLFNPGTREEWRKPMRAHYGLCDDEKILAFSAFGHFDRKGLNEAIAATGLLRKSGHNIRLLVLGGSPKTVTSYKRGIRQDVDSIIFAGLVDDIERHLSAADGFFFPSHFEAFSLSEIEAAALGLRLYLTPHYGHEMILREPDNGRLLPWEPDGMAAVIGDDMREGRFGNFHTELGEAVDLDGYQKLLHRYYLDSISLKESPQAMQRTHGSLTR